MTWFALLFLWILRGFPTVVQAGTPNIIITVDDEEWMAKRAEFGSESDHVQGRLDHAPDTDPYLCEYYRLGSTDFPGISLPSIQGRILMVPRGGECSNEDKAFVASTVYRADAILIYDRLEAHYRWDDETGSVIYPLDEWDYECSHGYGFVENIELDPPQYHGYRLDPILDMTLPTSNCTLEPTHTPCASQLCMITGPPRDGTSRYPVCCGWDLPATMTPDSDAGDTSQIVAVFLTIRQSQDILPHLGSLATVKERSSPVFDPSMIFLWVLAVAITFVACWLSVSDYRIFRAKLAMFQEKRDQVDEKNRTAADEEQSVPNDPNTLTNGIDHLDDDDSDDGREDDDSDDESDNDSVENVEESDVQDHPLDPNGNDENIDNEISSIVEDPDQRRTTNLAEQLPNLSASRVEQGESLDHPSPPAESSLPKSHSKKSKHKQAWVLHSLPPPERRRRQRRTLSNANHSSSAGDTSQEDHGREQPQQADGQVLPSDAGQRIPQPWAEPVGGFDIKQWHVFAFLVSASIILFMLFYLQFYNAIFILYGLGSAGAVSHLLFGPILVRVAPWFGNEFVRELNKPVILGMNAFDVTSQLAGFIWAILWIWYGITHYRPSTHPFFWVTINVFGGCFCVLGLSMLRLTNIRIATMLLLAVFAYDVFFVFITPFLMDGESVMIAVAKGGSEVAENDDYCYRYPEAKVCAGIDSLPMLLILPRINGYQDGSILLGLGDIVLPGYLIAFTLRMDEAKRTVGRHTKLDVDYPDKWYEGYFFGLMVSYAVGLCFAFLAYGITEKGQPALLYLVPCCLGTLCALGRHELHDMWNSPSAVRLEEKLRTRCEKAWRKEKMKRQTARRKRRTLRRSPSRTRAEESSRNEERLLEESQNGELPASSGRPESSGLGESWSEEQLASSGLEESQSQERLAPSEPRRKSRSKARRVSSGLGESQSEERQASSGLEELQSQERRAPIGRRMSRHEDPRVSSVRGESWSEEQRAPSSLASRSEERRASSVRCEASRNAGQRTSPGRGGSRSEQRQASSGRAGRNPRPHGRGGRGRGGRHPGRGQNAARGRQPTRNSARGTPGPGRQPGRGMARGRMSRGRLSSRAGDSEKTLRSDAIYLAKCNENNGKEDSVQRQASIQSGRGSRSPPRRKLRASLSEINSETSMRQVEPTPVNLVDKSPETPTPHEYDVCFGDNEHPGTTCLHRVVERELKIDPAREFGPSVLSSIRESLYGRQFFVSCPNGGWKVATDEEIRTEIEGVFVSGRTRMFSRA